MWELGLDAHKCIPHLAFAPPCDGVREKLPRASHLPFLAIRGLRSLWKLLNPPIARSGQCEVRDAFECTQIEFPQGIKLQFGVEPDLAMPRMASRWAWVRAQAAQPAAMRNMAQSCPTPNWGLKSRRHSVLVHTNASRTSHQPLLATGGVRSSQELPTYHFWQLFED